MARLSISDTNPGQRISSIVKEQMTICPPPITTDDGEVLSFPYGFKVKYKDLKAMKARNPIYIEDELDDSEEYHTTTRFRLLIRCMASDADIQLIMAASKHLNLVSQYTIKRGENDQLEPSLEMNYIEVFYTIGYRQVQIDNDLVENTPIPLSNDERKRIWMGLFKSAGYTPVWGNAINIKRKNL